MADNFFKTIKKCRAWGAKLFRFCNFLQAHTGSASYTFVIVYIK